MTKRTVRWTSPKVMALSREKIVPMFLSTILQSRAQGGKNDE